MKNRITAFLVLIALLVSMFSFVGCGESESTDNGLDNSGSLDNAGGSGEDEGKDEKDKTEAEIRKVYSLYVENSKRNNITPKSYEDWLESIKGEDGKDGITPEFKLENSELFVSYDEGATWKSLGKLVLEDGADKHEHNYENWKPVSASHYCEYLAYAECTDCGELDLKLIGEHSYGEWQFADPDCENPGGYWRVCSSCYNIEFKTMIDPLGHEPAEEYTYDNQGHWIECTRCGEKCGDFYETHNFDSTNVCKICGYDAVRGYLYDGSEVTITFYHTMSWNLQRVLDDGIARFNELFPNITVVHKQVGGYDDVVDQIRNELTAGNQPNIAYCYPDHVALYNKAGAPVALDNLIASTIEMTDAQGNKTVLGLTPEQIADFIPGYYKEGAMYDERGTMYTLPMSKSTEALYYNRTFFEEHNLKVPTTWDEMEALCRKIKEIDPNCIPLGYDSESNWFITMCEQLGSGYTSLDKNEPFQFDNAENRAFIERFAGWYKEGLVTTQELYGAYTSELFKVVDADKTKCYMVIGSTGGANHQVPPVDGKGEYVFEAAVATIPQMDNTNRKVISQGPSLVIFADSSKNQITKQEVAASWLFVKYLTTDVEFQAKFSMASGYAPVIKSVQDNETYKEEFLDLANGYNQLIAQSVKLALEQADAYYVSPAFVGSSVARKQVGLIIQNVFSKVLAGENAKDVIDAEFKRAMGECNYAVGK